jgi:hypothetical protein
MISSSIQNKQRKRKNHFEVSREARRKNKNQIHDKLLEFNSFLGSIGLALSPKTILIQKQNTTLQDESCFDFKISKNESISTPCSSVNKVLQTIGIVDSTYISESKYKILRKGLDLQETLPSLYKLRLMKSTFKDFFELEFFKNKSGYFLKYPLKKVEFVLKKLFEENPVLKETDKIILKIAGDGKIITDSNVELNNITFTVINDKARCKTSMGNYILGK